MRLGRYDDARIEAAIRELLIGIGEDPDRDGLRETPARVARAYREVFAGLRQTPDELLTTTFELGHQELVLVKDIEVFSICEHHLVPFHGKAHVGYIPGEHGRVTGLSKLARLVDLRPPPADSGADDLADRGRVGRAPRPAWRDRRRRVRTFVHVDAWGA